MSIQNIEKRTLKIEEDSGQISAFCPLILWYMVAERFMYSYQHLLICNQIITILRHLYIMHLCWYMVTKCWKSIQPFSTLMKTKTTVENTVDTRWDQGWWKHTYLQPCDNDRIMFFKAVTWLQKGLCIVTKFTNLQPNNNHFKLSNLLVYGFKMLD